VVRIINVSAADLDSLLYNGSVVVVSGYDDDGQRVTFAGDTGPMSAMIEAARTDGPVRVEVEEWQIWGSSDETS
jgi:hypothetical protein